MTTNVNREDLKNWALRALGHPAIQINITTEQLDDRIDDALDTWHEFHHEGTELAFVAYELTQDVYDNRVIEVDDTIAAVLNAVMLGSAYSQLNLDYQAYLQQFGSQIYVVGSSALTTFTISSMYLNTVRQIFARGQRIAFNQRRNKIYLHSSFSSYSVGDYIAFEVYTYTNPQDYREVYDDLWLKDYATALVKRQWGQNMLKYDGFQLPSGITLNGRQIYEDALRDIEELRRRLFNEESEPVDFFVG